MPTVLERYQILRDELRELLLKYFEYRDAMDRTKDPDELERIRENFGDHKRAMRTFHAFNGRMFSFIPGLVEGDLTARGAALQYLLTLLPETPVNPTE